MNILRGTILSVETSGNLSIIIIDVDGVSLRSIVIETPQKAPHLSLGNSIRLLFKETELILSKEKPQISLENIFPVQVESMEFGILLSKIRLVFNSYSLNSVITTTSAKNLKLQTGDKVFAMIKTNEIMLSI